jgi:hypothetical protein
MVHAAQPPHLQDLLEVMCTRSNAEIQALKDSYKAQ